MRNLRYNCSCQHWILTFKRPVAFVAIYQRWVTILFNTYTLYNDKTIDDKFDIHPQLCLTKLFYRIIGRKVWTLLVWTSQSRSDKNAQSFWFNERICFQNQNSVRFNSPGLLVGKTYFYVLLIWLIWIKFNSKLI